MDEGNGLAQQFENSRGRLRGVAYGMLGSPSQADDAVQETWLRLCRSDAGNIQNLGGWLTTVVARVCLDMLRLRTARPEESLETQPASVTSQPTSRDPEQEILLADSVGVALLVVLDRLSPAYWCALTRRLRVQERRERSEVRATGHRARSPSRKWSGLPRLAWLTARSELCLRQMASCPE